MPVANDNTQKKQIRLSIEQGNDMSVCLLNYRVDGTTFWNQFFIAALRDANGAVTNYVGVQCKVSEAYARNVCAKQAVGGAGDGGQGGDKGRDEKVRELRGAKRRYFRST